MARTKDFERKFAGKMQKQLDTVADDLYGGANDVTLGAGDLKIIDNIQPADGVELIVDSALNGTQAVNYHEIVAKMPTVELESKVYEQGVTDVAVSAMGWEALDGPKETGTSTGIFVHMIPLNINGKDQRAYTAAEAALVPSGYAATDRINLAMHMANNLGPSVEHYKNIYWKSFEFSSVQKQPLMLKATGTAELLTRDATKAGVSNWTKPTGAFIASLKHYNGAFYLGVNGGSAATARGITDFGIQVNHGLVEGVQPTGTSNGGLSQAEPLADGNCEVTLNFKVHKHDTDDWKTWENSDSIFLNAKMEYIRGNYMYGFYFPKLQVISAEIDPAGGSSVQVSCRAVLPDNMDLFTTERTVNSVEWEVPFLTPLFMMVKDLDDTNHMRAV